MASDTQILRDNILEKALPAVPFEGWTLAVLEQAAVAAGHAPAMVRAVFPDGVADALDHFSDMMDRRMMDALASVDINSLRVHDRIRAAVLARLEALTPHREAERLALARRGAHMVRGGRVLWRTADVIWRWAGDTATDYNRLTKRGLLSGVMASTILVWLNNGGDEAATAAFLDRRIENVMQWGRFLGKLRKTGPDRKQQA